MSEEFVGKGWAFPLRTNVAGGVALVQRERELEEAMELILRTAPGERPMRPEFGCGIHNYVFAPADSTTAGHLAYEVRHALERWEPRIDVVDVDVDQHPTERAALLISISYQIKGTNDPRNLVFPFYVIPAEE